MRLSGNYFDRLLINILPLTLFASIIIYLSSKQKAVGIATFVFLTTTIAFWLIDTSITYFKFKNPKPLLFSETLVWGNQKLTPGDIFRITPITDKRYRWSFDMIEFNLTDGTTFYIIDKPKNFIADILDKPSKTLKLLTDKYPELDEKISGRRFI